jgi:hypothetical protein
MFSVQIGPANYPASCTVGTGSFPGIKRPGSGVNHLSSTEVKERVELYLYYSSLLSRHVTELTLPFTLRSLSQQWDTRTVIKVKILARHKGMKGEQKYSSNRS